MELGRFILRQGEGMELRRVHIKSEKKKKKNIDPERVYTTSGREYRTKKVYTTLERGFETRRIHEPSGRGYETRKARIVPRRRYGTRNTHITTGIDSLLEELMDMDRQLSRSLLTVASFEMTLPR